MRLYEIIKESFDTATSYIDTELPDLRAERLKMNSELGKANQNDLYRDIGMNYKKAENDNPHVYKKEHHLYTKFHDAYSAFIYLINENKLAQSNPFFPRVFNIEIKRARGYIKPTFEMEPLLHFEDVNKEQLKALGNNLFINFDEQLKIFRNNLADTYVMCIAAREKGVKNKLLLKALAFIDKILEEYPEYIDDLHGNNIMFRSTPYGPQLVLSDPLAS